MPDKYQFALALRALREVQAEIGQVPAPGQTLFPGLADTLDAIGNLPVDSLLFGVAGDGLPLLLHLRDPRTGPILITADQGSGKTAFLKMLLLAGARLSRPGSIRFAVLTDFPDDWAGVYAPEHLTGVWPAYDPEAATLLYDLASRAQAGDAQIPVVLLFDGLDSILHMEDACKENLGYLLRHGPQALLWPVVAVNSERAVRLPEWLAFFRTRIYGRIVHPKTTEELTPIPGASLNTLFPGSQFCIREKSHWLKFWLPSMPE